MRRVLRQTWIILGTLVAIFVVSWIYYMPNGQERGAWRAQSGGSIITLSALQAKLYSETSTSCVEQLTFPAHMKLVEWAEGATIEVSGDTMMLSVDGSVQATPYVRIDALPDSCTTPRPDATPREVFDALWSAMDEHYAFFDLHGVDWNARQAFRPTADADMSDEALFALLSQTLEGFDDGHIQLGTPVGFYSPAEAPSWFAEGPAFTREALWQAARDAVGVELTPVPLTAIDYALLPDGIGYVMIRSMSLDTPFGAREEPAMALAFEEVAEALAQARVIIIDVRYNPGGSDTVSFGVASHFIDQPIDVFTKTTRDGVGQTDPFTATLMPFDDSPLTQPVILLTTKLTGSAAEILTMSMRELDHVTTMGEATGGGLSDIAGFKLPNGWDFGLSHQTYRTLDGALYEAIGIPPDVPFDLDAGMFTGAQDLLLEAALDRARSQ